MARLLVLGDCRVAVVQREVGTAEVAEAAKAAEAVSAVESAEACKTKVANVGRGLYKYIVG